MTNQGEVFNLSDIGHGVGVKPGPGAHESRQLKVEDRDLILENVWDKLAFTMSSGRPNHLSMTESTDINAVSRVTYKTPEDAESAEKIVKAESLK